MSIGFHPPTRGQLHADYSELVESSHYQHYAPYRQQIDTGMDLIIPSVLEDLNTFYGSMSSELANHEVRYKSARSSRRWLAVAAALALILAVGLSIVHWGPGAASGQWWMLPLAVIFIAGAAFNWRLSVRARAEVLVIEGSNSALKVLLERKTHTAVKEAFTQVLNATLGPENKLPFPTVAPRLVELNTSTVVPSSTSTFLKNFVEGHESSAIGIAGPRGSGKSTLMRGLTLDVKHIDRSVWLTAPVRYDSVDFMRRLYLEVAKKIDARNGSELAKWRQRRSSSVFVIRATIGVISIGLGLTMLTFDSYGVEIFNQRKLGPAGITGIFLAVVGSLLTLLGMMTHVTRRSYGYGGFKTRDQTHSAFLAREAITRLSYDRETNTKSKNVVKFFGPSLALEDENSITLRDRTLSHADLVSELRTLLQAFAQDEKHAPIIIVIDELDKISLTADLIDTVNDLKDLFHIEGVHFVVSVSTEALLSFEQRALIARDAFDSSFDTIAPVHPLSLDESLQVISARAEGFPPLVAAFCHAWSGGLPRELLRVARRCVEIQRSTQEAQPVEFLVRTVIAEDTVSLVEAAMRSTTNSAERAYLHMLRLRGRSLREGHPSICPAVDIPTSLGNIASVSALGEELALFFATSVKDENAEWSTPDRLREPLEAASAAMALRAEPEEIKIEAFAKASSALISSVPA